MQTTVGAMTYAFPVKRSMSDPPHPGHPSDPKEAFSAAFAVIRRPHSWQAQSLLAVFCCPVPASFFMHK
jgi:hypothetical protein